MVAQSKFDPRKLGSLVRPHPFVELNSWIGGRSGLHFGQLLSYRSILRPWWISEGTTIEMISPRKVKG